MSYYDENVINHIDLSIVLHPMFDDWFIYVEDILLNDEFQKRKLFSHHHNISVWDHSILVSFKSFLLAKYFGADMRICAIAGLLHDFYSQAWLYNDELAKLDDGKYLKDFGIKKPLFKMHGFTHASDAANNYVKYFPELEHNKITDSIKKHMFPLNIKLPKYKEGYIITWVDKLNSVRELPSISLVCTNQVNKLKNIIINFFYVK